MTMLDNNMRGKIIEIYPNYKLHRQICKSCLGVCLTDEECQNAGGSKDGACASGFGVCCLLRYFEYTRNFMKLISYL